MFSHLPGWQPEGQSPDEQERSLQRLIDLHFRIDRPEEGSSDAGDNHSIPAGYTYLGQLIAHDLSFEVGPAPTDAGRTPRLDLDCLYGRGPFVDAHLYGASQSRDASERIVGMLLLTGHAEPEGDAQNRGELDLPRLARVGIKTLGGYVHLRREEAFDSGDLQAELQRLGWRLQPGKPLPESLRLERVRTVRYQVNPECLVEDRLHGRSVVWAELSGRFLLSAREAESDGPYEWLPVPAERMRWLPNAPVIADPRNDATTLTAQLHLALAQLHNRVLRSLEQSDQSGTDPAALFDRARRMVCWIYQRVILEDYMERILHPRVLAGLPDQELLEPGLIPVEFTAAAFRFGHSMVRPSYRLNSALEPRFPIFSQEDVSLAGGRHLPARWSLEWSRFATAGPDTEWSRAIDPAIAAGLWQLPGPSGAQRLVELDLRLAWSRGVPSGQAIARELGIGREWVLPPVGGREDPLLLYVLREAADARIGGAGRFLGPVGSEVVGRVLYSALANDPDSILNTTEQELASIPDSIGELYLIPPPFGLIDLLRLSGQPLGRSELERYWRGEEGE